jgi:hypothetical protein
MTEQIADATLDPRSTLVVLDPDGIDREDVSNLARFVGAGGRLVAGGSSAHADAWLQPLTGPGFRRDRSVGGRAQVLAPVVETAGVRAVRTGGLGAWTATGGALPVLGRPGSAVVVVRALGTGRVVALADASPIQNRLLASADNAALAIGLAGDRARTVHFVESVHGYGTAYGFGAIPFRWRVAGAIVLAAVAMGMLSRGRRLGPPELGARPLGPPRRAFVDALAATLARTRNPLGAAEPVRAAIREHIARRAGLPAGTPDDEIARAARRLGMSGEDADAVLSTDVMVLGRTLARLETKPRP